jgi:hypothetical protein
MDEFLVETTLKDLKRRCKEEGVRVSDLLRNGMIYELNPTDFAYVVRPMSLSKTKAATRRSDRKLAKR